MAPSCIDVTRASLHVTGDKTYTVDDPGSRYLAHAELDASLALVSLSITAREPGTKVTRSVLARVPTDHIRRAGVTLFAASGSSVRWWSAGAGTHRVGRSWSHEHWAAVLAVYNAAQHQGAPRGAGTRAVAEAWGVTVAPTAQRWVRKAKDAAESDPAASAGPVPNAATSRPQELY